MNILKHFTLFVLLLSPVLIGCNMFSWTNGKEESQMDKGLDLMRQGRYAEAEMEFARLMEKDPNNADARYHHAKATLNRAGFDIIDLLRDITQAEADREHLGATIPLYDKEIPAADEIYRVNLTIAADLRPIHDGFTHGSIRSEDIDVDLAIAFLVCAILGLRDTNQDSTIDDNDIRLDINFSADLGEYSIHGLEQFLEGEGLARSLDDRSSSLSPDDINPLIDYVLYLIEESEDVIITVVQERTEGWSVESIQTLLDDVRTTIVKYYYDDGRDNDSDGSIDEETLNGLDDDKDGYVDEDTDHV